MGRRAISSTRARVPQTRGLSRQYNRVLKDIFKGAATSVITQRNKGPLYPRYQEMLAGGTKPSLARLTLARIIAEGLSTLEELETLGTLDIPFGRGWPVGKPTPLRTDT